MSKIASFTDEKLLRVYVQNVPVCTGTTRTHVSTCARGVGTHGDVLNVTQRRRVEWTPRTHTTRRQRQRQTETEKEDRDRERREDGRGATRQDNRRQDKTREERRFIFSVVVHGRFLMV